MPNKKFWAVSTSTDSAGATVGHLYLYGVISTETWWGDEVTPKMILDDLNSLGDVAEINVHIFSEGGDVFAGCAIYTILKQHKAKINIYIEGLAASIASVIAMAGDVIYISSAAMMLLHNPMCGLFGYYNEGELSRMMADLQKIREPLIGAYTNKSGLSREDVVAILDGTDGAGTWYLADEAIAAGLADALIPDEIEDTLGAVASIGRDRYRWKDHTFDLSTYKNAPKLAVDRRNKNMSKKKGSHKAAEGVKGEVVAVTCPECGVTFDVTYDAETLEGDVIVVTCPECEAEFEYYLEDKPQEGQPADKLKAEADVATVTCPTCGATFEWPYDIPEGSDATVVEVTCPECGVVFGYDTATGTVTESAGGDPGSTQDKYQAGVKAERARIAKLDTIVAADPGTAKLVAMAKQEGWSFEKTAARAFAAMAARQKTPDSYQAVRKRELAKSGEVNAAPDARGANTPTAKAAASIVAGFSKK